MIAGARRFAAAAAAVAAGLVALDPVTAAGAATRPSAVPGTATATATAYTFAVGLNGGIGSGGSRLGLTRGLSSVDARDDTAVAKGIALDLGLIANFNRLPTDECPNIEPLFDPATLPQLVQVESGDAGAATPRPGEVRFPGLTGPGPVAGVQDATAGPGTSGASRTDVPDGDGPFIMSRGLRTETSSSVDPSGRRSSTAVVTATSIEVAGLFTIGAPRFTARSAGDGTSGASFTYDWVLFLGQYHTGAAAARALQDGKALAEGLFGFLGLKVDLPAGNVVTKQNPSSDTTFIETVELSPLRVRLSNIPIARDLIGPILQVFGADIDRFLDTYLVDDPCADPGLSNVITIARGLLSGDGELGTSLGAVTASTSDRWVAPPPPTTTTTVVTAAPSSAVQSEVAERPVGTTPRTVASDVATTVPTTVADTVPETTVTTAPPTTVAVREAGTAVRRPITEVVSRRGGALAWAAGALLALVACLAVADRTVLARRRVS